MREAAQVAGYLDREAAEARNEFRQQLLGSEGRGPSARVPLGVPLLPSLGRRAARTILYAWPPSAASAPRGT
jgi:hypothetical protein